MYGGRLGELKKLNLNVLQMHTVIMLNYHGPQRMGAIANYLGCPLSRATTIVGNLVSKNYVQRGPDPNDRRAVICDLTDLGAGGCRAVLKSREAACAQSCKPVGFGPT